MRAAHGSFKEPVDHGLQTKCEMLKASILKQIFKKKPALLTEENPAILLARKINGIFSRGPYLVKELFWLLRWALGACLPSIRLTVNLKFHGVPLSKVQPVSDWDFSAFHRAGLSPRSH